MREEPHGGIEPLETAGETVGSARLYGGTEMSVPLVTKEEVRILVPRGASERLTGHIVYDGPVPAPVEQGREIARLRVMRGQTLAVDLPLVAGESVAVGPLHRRALDAALELGETLVRTYVLKH